MLVAPTVDDVAIYKIAVESSSVRSCRGLQVAQSIVALP